MNSELTNRELTNQMSKSNKTKGFFYKLKKNYKKRKMIYWMMVPGLLTYIIFKYIPMYGLIIAFEKYNPYGGIPAFWNSPWVGLQWFKILFHQDQFWLLFRNTLTISIYNIVFGFPIPIILAILFNELRGLKFKRISQSLVYLPHFLSWAIVSGILIEMLSPNGGMVNNLLGLFGVKPIFFLSDTHFFRPILISAGIWKEMGWDSVIFLAAIVGIDTALYEAAVVDGANKWKQILHITLPSLVPIMSIVLILAVGRVMDTGFAAIYTLYNQNVYGVADVFSTYIYRVGIGGGQFSYVTALGLFQNIVNMILLVLANRISKYISGNGLW
jgi:putative aldouronate transport system permease protein